MESFPTHPASITDRVVYFYLHVRPYQCSKKAFSRAAPKRGTDSLHDWTSCQLSVAYCYRIVERYNSHIPLLVSTRVRMRVQSESTRASTDILDASC